MLVTWPMRENTVKKTNIREIKRYLQKLRFSRKILAANYFCLLMSPLSLFSFQKPGSKIQVFAKPETFHTITEKSQNKVVAKLTFFHSIVMKITPNEWSRHLSASAEVKIETEAELCFQIYHFHTQNGSYWSNVVKTMFVYLLLVKRAHRSVG